MAFPSLEQAIGTDGTTASGTPVINLPVTGLAAGDLFVVVFRVAVAGVIGWPDGSWIEMFDASSDAADDQMALAYRQATGSEGSTISLTCTSGKFAAAAWRIRGHINPSTQVPELSTVATGTTPNNPNATAVTPTGGAKDYLFGTICGMEGEATNPPTYPTNNFTLGQVAGNSGTGGAVTTNCMVAGAWRQLNAASVDPGEFTYGGTIDDWTAYAIAVHPDAVAAFFAKRPKVIPQAVHRASTY